MIQPLTPQEKAELSAWIAEHVYQWTNVRFGTMVNLAMLGSTERWYGTPLNSIEQPVPDYCTWQYAGLLFDRYEFVLERFTSHEGQAIYSVSKDNSKTIYDDDKDYLADGTTGPEAIAKAVKQYEEQRRG